MATVVPPQGAFNRDESQNKIRHPLQRLRAYIRSYVTLEGISIFLLYLVIWFWVGLLLDFGVFKLFGFDWVREMPGLVGTQEFSILRIGLLVILLAGLAALVILKVVLRLAREFRERALALVLERRFPKILGDRLITAVEMADPKLAAEFGHSQAMVDQTIREAAERVDQVPVKEVFNWNRLYRYGGILAGATLGLYLFALLAYCLLAQEEPLQFFYRSRDVAAIWAERNLLLENSLWPRNAYLEVIHFAGSKKDPLELRIDNQNSSTDLWVRSAQWVVADDKAPDGWRPLRWLDLKEILGQEPAVSLPAGWNGWALDPDDPFTGDWRQWTVDRIFLEVQEKKAIRQKLRSDFPGAFREFEAVADRLDELAREGSRERMIRKLDLPGKVMLVSYGPNVTNTKTFVKRDDNKYQTGVTLTESVKFVVQADDFTTGERKITLVPRPRLDKLRATRMEPAYIYYRMKGEPGDLAAQRALTGARLEIKDQEVGITDQASFIELPAGSDITLVGEVTDTLQGNIRALPFKDDKAGPRNPGLMAVQPQFIDDDADNPHKKFMLEFKNVQEPLDFVLRFVNEDNVEGECHISIEPKADKPPEVSLQMVKNIFRQKPNTEYFMVTPRARVPFEGSILDDRGLNRVVWSFQARAIKKEATLAKIQTLMTAHQFLPSPVGPVLGPVYASWVIQRMTQADKKGKDGEQNRIVGLDTIRDDTRLRNLLANGTAVEGERLVRRFLEEIAFRKEDEVPEVDALQILLKKGKIPQRGLTRQVRLGNDDAFSFREFLGGLAEPSGNSTLQLRCVVEVWVTAVDNNVQVEHPAPQPASADEAPLPGKKELLEPGAVSRVLQRFQFLVVGENELLADIFREEEELRIELERIYKKLQEARTKLNSQVLPNLADNLDKESRSLKATRADEVKKTVGLHARDLGVVHAAFNRILLELEYNEVHKESISRVQDGICEPLRLMLDKNTGVFHKAELATEKLQTILETGQKGSQAAGEEARLQLEDLLKRLAGVLDKMQKITDKDTLVRIAVELEERQRKQSEELEAHRKYLEDVLLRGIREGN